MPALLPRPLIAPIANPPLEEALRRRLAQHRGPMGGLGELEPLALQIGLVQNTLRPSFVGGQLVVFAADHGLAVDGAGGAGLTTAALVQHLLHGFVPLAGFARVHGLTLSVVDSGIAEAVLPHPRLLARKIAHGTRNARAGGAMSQDQVEAAVRAGMEISAALPGNAVACAGIGLGSHESAALLLAQVTGTDPSILLEAGGAAPAEPERTHVRLALEAAHARHREVSEPLMALAALGGFEVAMMVGLMLSAASRRQLILPDGLPACAALVIATRITPAVADYVVHCRSHDRPGLDAALGLLQASALLELGINSIDGTGAALAWPLVRSAAALLTEVADVEEATVASRVSLR